MRKGEGTVAQLANTNEARHVFVEHLEAAHKLLKLAGLAEAVGAVQDLEKGFEVNCFWEGQSGKGMKGRGGQTVGFDSAYELVYFAVGGILPARTQKIA